MRRQAPDRLGQREAGEQVDHVVLAQVDEPEAERQRVGPADRAVAAPDPESTRAAITDVPK